MDRRLVAAGTGAALVAGLLVTGSLPASSAAPASRLAADDETPPTIVGLGDSFMSGEGVLYGNHNFGGSDFKSGDSTWNTVVGPISGNPVTNEAVANAWGSVYGDANDYPATGGKESIPYCDRSYSAAMHVGGGWTSKNLACSGATVNSVINDKGNFKPGIDDKTVENDQGVVVGVGQTKLLKEYAATNKNIEVIALSIGGNDFGFADIASKCITAQSTYSECEKSTSADSVNAMVEKGGPVTQAAVTTAIKNIAEAMKDAGYDQSDWKLVYQNPPMPVPTSANIKYNNTGGILWNNERANYGGCGLYNSTLDWIYGKVYPRLIGAMNDGIADARTALGRTQIIQLDTEKTFNGHKLCEKSTIGATNYPKNQAGKTPKWEDNNGKKTEWVSFVIRADQLSGNIYQKSTPLHPNYWGQRALSDCMSNAKDVSGAVRMQCVQDGDGWDPVEAQPDMKLQEKKALWVVATGKPLIDGNPNVGQTLTAISDGVFEPADATVEYQWRSADGFVLSNEQTLVVPPETLGKEIYVSVKGSSPGIPDAEIESERITISDLTVVTAPAIAGTPKVGQTLTASPGTYSAVPTSVTYQWLADGEVIEGATGTTYVPTGDELGRKISVIATVQATGFSPLEVMSDPTADVTAADFTVAGKPTITGEAMAGKTLTASASGVTFTPEQQATSYRWYRDGQLIPSQNEATYEIGDGDQGKVITVRAVGHSEAYEDGISEPSDPTETVSKGKIELLKQPKLKYYENPTQAYNKIPKKGAHIGLPIRPELFGVFSEWPSDPDVKWFRFKDGDKERIQGANDLEYVATPEDIGFQLQATIKTTNSGFKPADADTDKVKVIKGKPAPQQSPAITGTPKVGKKLRCVRARFLPESAKVRCEWLRNGKKIKNAKGLRYQLTKKDKGKRIQVRSYTVETKVYNSSSVKSKKTKKVRG